MKLACSKGIEVSRHVQAHSKYSKALKRERIMRLNYKKTQKRVLKMCLTYITSDA